jgi:hypothetical protein
MGSQPPQGKAAMKLPLFSIARLMAIVAFVGLNLASTQFWSHSSHPSLLTGRLPTSIALQVGLFCLIRSRRSKSFTFWIGFEAFGLAAAITSIYIDLFSPDDSNLADINDLYLDKMYNLLGNARIMINDPYWRGVVAAKLFSHDGGFIDNMLFELVSFMPQLFMAVIGGFLMALLRKARARPKAAGVPIGIG